MYVVGRLELKINVNVLLCSLNNNDGTEWNHDEIPTLTAAKVLPNDWEASPFRLSDGEFEIDGNNYFQLIYT